MERTFSCILLLLCWATTSSKYVYVDTKMTWLEARKYCQLNHADLAHVSNQRDNQRLQEKKSDRSWFGLYRDLIFRDKWRWAGGGKVTVFSWANDQPTDKSGENCGLLCNDGWHDYYPDQDETFLCYNPIVVKERKTWEEAVRYCRQKHSDIASLLSDTEVMLVSNVLLKAQISEPVWIGLHFFSGKWLWVDGETSEYKAWGQQGEPACPNPLQACAALSVAANVTGVYYTANGAAVPREWEAWNCGDSLPFICY